MIQHLPRGLQEGYKRLLQQESKGEGFKSWRLCPEEERSKPCTTSRKARSKMGRTLQGRRSIPKIETVPIPWKHHKEWPFQEHGMPKISSVFFF